MQGAPARRSTPPLRRPALNDIRACASYSLNYAFNHFLRSAGASKVLLCTSGVAAQERACSCCSTPRHASRRRRRPERLALLLVPRLPCQLGALLRAVVHLQRARA